MITINSESETIAISDRWQRIKDVEWKVSLFNNSADSHGISINYPSQITNEENQVEVCLSGSKTGRISRSLLLREEQQGNSIVQMGVWLKAIISEK